MRPWIFAVALVALGLPAAGCGGTATSGVGASSIVPASVPAFIAIDTNPDSSQWKAVDRLANRFPDKQKAVTSLEKSLRNKEGLDWNHDVKPALGDHLDLAWLDFGNGGRDVVGLVQPKDEGKFRHVIETGNRMDASTKLYYEKFNGWIVLSERHSVIDRFKHASETTKETLADQPAFTHAMNTLGDGVVRAYVDGSAVAEEIDRYLGADAQPYMKKLGTLDWIASNLGATTDGLHEDVIVHGTPGSAFKHVHARGFGARLTNTVPQDALLYFTFHGSKGMFDGLQSNAVLRSPQVRPYLNVLQNIGSILQGENALYLRTPASGRLPEITFVAAPGRGGDPAATLDSVLAGFRRQLPANLRRSKIAGADARTLDFGRFGISYANVGGKLVVTDLPSGIRGIAAGGRPLAQNDEYQGVVRSAGMPVRTEGFLYVNIHSSHEIEISFFLRVK